MLRPAIILLALTVPAAAQTVVDGSAARLNAGVVQLAMEKVSDEFADPGSTQFRRLRSPKAGVYCGQVNARKRMGGYVGFRSFAVSLDPSIKGSSIVRPVGDQLHEIVCFTVQILGCGKGTTCKPLPKR